MAIPAGEMLFLDTNVLVAATDESRPFHAVARTLIARGRSVGLHGATSGQVIREYLVVATRPLGANGLGLSPADALGNIEKMTRHLQFCDEPESVSVRLRRLVGTGDIAGKATHDANIVATIVEQGIGVLATENPEDFAGYPEIGVVRLSEVANKLPATDGPR
ncbi:MAG TPA: type II toxin-antitoxin system VapC family toxin [Desulfobacterales bacterium]|nr:type II toxin-antitoxin system VapC family toxin [Desulfobacterales bacterium]